MVFSGQRREYTLAMTPRSLELLKQALALTEEERAELASSLLKSLDAQSDPQAEALWQVEVERRVSELDASAGKTIPWEEVQARTTAILQHGPKKR